MRKLSLYNLSVQKTSQMLKQQFWRVTDDWEIGKNLFSYLPTSVVEDLFSCVIKISATLNVNDVYHLVTSGRIKNFRLEHMVLKPEVLLSMLKTVSVACHSLKSFILRDITIPAAHDFANDDLCSSPVRSAVAECIVNSESNLEKVESCISFDLKAVRRCTNLKILRLNFHFSSSLLDILDERDGVHCVHNSLQVLAFSKYKMLSLPSTDIAALLTYCPELTELKYDISKALEFLHKDQMHEGTLSRQYKLKKCLLGGSCRNYPYSVESPLSENSSSASQLAVRICTLTCPLMEEVDIIVDDDSTVSELSNFLNLKSLFIYWPCFSTIEFQIVHLLLENVGANLKVLHVVNILQVDFVAIGKLCPNLEFLKVVCLLECPSVNDSCCALFRNLKFLFISRPRIAENTLLLLLSNCKTLTTLCILSAAFLNDRVLSEVLSRNPMSKVKDATISKCSLSGVGVRNLINHLKKLKILHFSSSVIEFKEAASVVRQINPAVRCVKFS